MPDKEDLNLRIPATINLTNRFRTVPGKANISMGLIELRERRRKILELWIKIGSLEKVCDEIGKETGKRPTPITARKYAIAFMLEYPSEARKIYQAAGEFLDTPEGDLDWMWHIVNIAVRQLKSKQDFIRWTLKNNLYKKAFKLFKDTYSLSDADFTAFDDILETHDKPK